MKARADKGSVSYLAGRFFFIPVKVLVCEFRISRPLAIFMVTFMWSAFAAAGLVFLLR